MIREPAQVPVVIVPKAVKDEFVTPVPNEDEERTVVLLILYVLPETKFQDSEDDQPTPAYQFIDLSVEPLRVIPPPSAVTSVGELTEPNSIFLSSTVRVTEFMVVVVPFIVKSPATNKLPPMPTPPVTTNAPVAGLVEAVEPVTFTVAAFTDTPAVNVFVVSVLDAGLNNSPASEETATPLPPFVGENKI